MPAPRKTLVTFVAGAFVAFGCGQQLSPTGPTPAASVAPPTASSLVGPARAEPQVPFQGTLQGVDEDLDPTETSIVVVTDGSGAGTQLGKFTFTQRVTLSFQTGTATGTASWIAANGDRLETTVSGSGHPTETPGEFAITDIHEITGGTGRFAGAAGTFTVQRVASGITFLTSGSFSGSITPSGAAH